MIHMCDMVLTFLLVTTPGADKIRHIYTHHTNAEKFLDENQYGKLIDVEATKQFDCKSGPPKGDD